MSRNRIEQQIQAEFSELREWLLDRDWKQWDTQIASDVSAGRLDESWQQPPRLIRHASTRFWSLYDALLRHRLETGDKSYALLRGDPRHPSLHFKR